MVTSDVRKAVRAKITEAVEGYEESGIEDYDGSGALSDMYSELSSPGLQYPDVVYILQRLAWDRPSAVSWARGLMRRGMPGARDLYSEIVGTAAHHWDT
jgi:hypothetical protein